MKPGVIRLYEFKVRRRRLSRHPFENVQDIDRLQPHHLADVFRRTFKGEAREHFTVFHVDIYSKLIGFELIAIGGLSYVVVSPREVFRGALLSSASGLVLAHNHPSGTVTPSTEDDELTYRMHAAGELLDIPVMDHLVVCDHAHYSYLEHQRPLCKST